MAGRARWRPATAVVLGAVAVVAAVVGGVQAVGAAPETVDPVPVPGPVLPGSSDATVPVPPAGATLRPPVFAPSGVVTSPAPASPSGSARPVQDGTGAAGEDDPPHSSPRSADSPADAPADRSAAGRPPSSGETQFEWGCRQGYITRGC